MTENKETQSTIDEQLEESSKKFYEKHGYCFNVTKQGVRVEVNKTSFEGLHFFADFMLKKVRDNPKKAKTEAVINFQFAGKSYTTDDLVRIAKDVWKYDLNQKEADFKTVELYVKPEESLAYYVINGKFTGNFFI